MKISSQLSDQELLSELGERLAAVRKGRNLTQAYLAEEAGISKRTLERMESGAVSTQLSSFLRVVRQLRLLERLDVLLPEPTLSPMDQLKSKGKKRQRASSNRNNEKPKGQWTWNEV